MFKQSLTVFLIVLVILSFVNFANAKCESLQTLNVLDLTQDELITQLTDPCRYDKIAKPNNSSPVYVQIDLNHMESQQIQFTAYMTVQYRYNDLRLAYRDLDPQRDTLYGEATIKDRIWVPHLIISNGKDSNRLGIDNSDIFITIDPDGNVVLTQRMSALFYCWMDLFKFPFDAQKCSLTWRSWTSNTSHLILYWDPDQPVAISRELTLAEFYLDQISTYGRFVSGPFPSGPIAGNFSELVFEFHLERAVGYYMLCYFLPSVLLVIISWVTFWLQADAAPARATLGASTGVAFITLSTAITKDLPKYSGYKASDIWGLVIALFIYASLAEFAFVNVIWRRRKNVELIKADVKSMLVSAVVPRVARTRNRKKSAIGVALQSIKCEKQDNKNDLQEVNAKNQHHQHQNGKIMSNNEQQLRTVMSPQQIAIWVDRKARICFPCAFLLFNVFYWTLVYLI